MKIWLTGCTSGLGRALVPEFLKAGHTLVGCGRNEIALEHLKNKFPKATSFPVMSQATSWFLIFAKKPSKLPELLT